MRIPTQPVCNAHRVWQSQAVAGTGMCWKARAAQLHLGACAGKPAVSPGNTLHEVRSAAVFPSRLQQR